MSRVVVIGAGAMGLATAFHALKRGHQVMLGAGNAYRFTAAVTGVLLQQTVLGELSVQKWREICLT